MRLSAKIRRTITMTVLGAMMLGGFAMACDYECHYSVKAIVTEVAGDEVTVKDNRGEEWSFCGKGYEEGQEVKVTFFTNDTDGYIYDDEIVDVKIK